MTTKATTYYPLKPIWDCSSQLEAMRESKQLSQIEFARAVGIAHSAYWRIENGGEVKMSTAYAIAKFHGVSVGQIWNRRLDEIVQSQPFIKELIGNA